jgi:diguanylate cyclase (GGDEF)-like protein
LLLLPAVGLAAFFNRWRAFVALASLLAAYTGYSIASDAGGFAARAVFTSLAILVPFNILAALALPERGMRTHHNYRWIMLAVAQLALVTWIAVSGRSGLSGTAWQAIFDHWLLRSPPTPIPGRLLFGAAFALAVYRAWFDRSPVNTGLAGALAAFFIACEWSDAPPVFSAFMSAAGAILLVSLLQESHRLAFKDELTGLPGRRALEEHLPALGPVFTMAMVDVDHFKKFNDSHGHDIGDQVLRLVAAQLALVGGGGAAYRYGGEEFCVLFPGQHLDSALPHLEALRQRIEHYAMAVRSVERPRDIKQGKKQRGGQPTQQMLSVTVSIGVAERSRGYESPALVLKAADVALYRAKQSGRNRVSQ